MSSTVKRMAAVTITEVQEAENGPGKVDYRRFMRLGVCDSEELKMQQQTSCNGWEKTCRNFSN